MMMTMMRVKNLSFFLALFSLLLACGKKNTPTGQHKQEAKTDTVKTQAPPAEDKSYLKKRPEEFKEFVFLSSVEAFTGKVATKKDVEEKKAAFNLDSKKDPSHKALRIGLPFYAFLKQPGQNKSKFVVIIQAESLKGDTILGFRDGTGMIGICKPKELELFESQKDKTYQTLAK